MKVGAGLALFGLVCPLFWPGIFQYRDMVFGLTFMHIHCDRDVITGEEIV